MTIQQAYRKLTTQLYEVYDTREAANIADEVLEHITGQRKIDRIMNKELPVLPGHQKQLDAITTRLLQHEPMQYVLGKAWFARMPFYVNEHVLIPRPETDELVSWIVQEVKQGKDDVKVIDIGTGSGCIPIALKKQLPHADVSAMDVSEKALEVARQNADQLGAEVTFHCLDFLDTATWDAVGTFDIIVSNPPYIRQTEAEQMHANVLKYEPHLALFVPDDNALVFYEAIAAFAKNHLQENGMIFLEINEALGNEIVKLFRSAGYSQVVLKQDMQAKERMVMVKA